jgi:monoamine oxidase
MRVQVTVVGAGVSGLCTAFELKRRGFTVQVLEASSRVGGRVITFRDPVLAPQLHAEGGAMRIPGNHFLLHQYIQDFGLENTLFDFEMRNKFIYLSGLPTGKQTLTYDQFNEMLKAKDPQLMALFPNLKDEERGKTCDELFDHAVSPVKELWNKVYDENAKPQGSDSQTGHPVYDAHAIELAYKAITDKYDSYSLRSYLTDVAHWSEDAINLYDLGNAHVVFENGFIESFKDAFLSSNSGGQAANMQQLQDGMDAVPKGFLNPYPEKGLDDSLLNNITFGARVKKIGFGARTGDVTLQQEPIKVYYDNQAGVEVAVESDYLVLAIPYTSQRSITKERAFVPKQEMAIRDVRYVEVTKVLLQYSQRWWKDIFDGNKQGTDGGAVCDLPIRYTMFPKEKDNSQFANNNPRGAVMAAYTFEQDATILGALSPERRVQLAARNLDTIFPSASSLRFLEASASQVFPADELAGGSAFCYFGPVQKKQFLETMMESDWNDRVFFAGEQASYTHGWIQGALEAALRVVGQVVKVATNPLT